MYIAATLPTQRALTHAHAEAQRLGQRYVGPEHLLLGLLADPDSHGARLLLSQGTDVGALQGTIFALLEGEPRHPDALALLTPQALQCIKAAWDEAQQQGREAVGTEHLLVGMLADPISTAAHALAHAGVTLTAARTGVQQLAVPEPTPTSQGEGNVHLYLPEEGRELAFFSDVHPLAGDPPDPPADGTCDPESLDKTVDFLAFKEKREHEMPAAPEAEPVEPTDAPPPSAGLQELLGMAFEQGRLEVRLEVARAMLGDGIDPSVVQHYLGLRPQDLG